MSEIKTKAWFEIFLIVSASFAFAYFARNSGTQVVEEKNDINLKESILNFMKYIIGDNFASAATISAISTCPVSNKGEICQEFASTECSKNCNVTCIPSKKEDVSSCKLGTCYDSSEGTCQLNSPKAFCEKDGGKWFNDPYGGVQECVKGCCVLGDQAAFLTSQQCSRQSNLLGITKEFKSEIKYEIECLALSKTQEEGACIIQTENLKGCNFVTKKECMEKQGEFHSGYLCSATELQTNCTKQKTSGCVEGKDEIYWFDSCGNRENIYSADKSKSWNDGKVLSKNESCKIDPLNSADRKTCGNCNYLLGSICGAKTRTEKLADNTQNSVCRDLSCMDENGVKRKNGESWCQYQGSVGVDKTNNRATDVVGSRDFRKVCIDGEVRSEPCADYRNEICIEEQSPISGGGKLSSAACRINRWQECISYNTEVQGKGDDEISAEQKARDNKCTKNPDCFIKEINIDDGFKFNICAPKYPAGFALGDSNKEGSDNICSLASQTCTVVYVKGLGGWDCKANCECEDEEFTEQMNNLCISLGDCGAKANYLGQISESYTVSGADKLSNSYLESLKKYSKTVKNQFIEAGDPELFYGSLGIPEGLGTADDKSKDSISGMLTVSGAAGGLLLAAAYLAPAGWSFTAGSASLFSNLPLVGGIIKTPAGGFSGVGTTASGLGGSLAGFAVGFAATGFLLKITGIGKGLSPAMNYALMTLGGIGGGAAGMAVAGTYTAGASLTAGTITSGSVVVGGTTVTATAAAPVSITTTTTGVSVSGGTLASGTSVGGTTAVAGPGGATTATAATAATVAAVLIAVVIILILVMYLMGIGKTKEKKVVFKCEAWEPPYGGKQCSKCGQNGLPCSEYACESLGQTCQFINEGTTNAMCVDISPNDVAAPTIKPMEKALLAGYSYSGANDEGVFVKGPEECIKSYTNIRFGIETNEPAQCKMDVKHTTSFADMSFGFGGDNSFLKNHTMEFSVPSLESMGLPGYDPNRRAEYNLYVRCKDKNGNENLKEYAISFCVVPGTDQTPPIVTAREPADVNLKYNTTSVGASVYTNEPSECRWDSSDKDYSQMSKTFQCDNDFSQQRAFGWQCSTNFPIGKNDSTFYVRCRDQPWLNESTKRNAMQQSYPFFFVKSSEKLKIDSITPDNSTLKFGVSPATIEIIARTSGGISGEAKCSFLIGSSEVEFADTYSNTHKQILRFEPGKSSVQIICEDTAGNTANKNATFIVEVDDNAPIVTRVYGDGGVLSVITNENAQCAINGAVSSRTNPCSFDFENGTLMVGNEMIHTISGFTNSANYIKCKDEYGNMPGGCSIIVSGG